jgi:hypothetical protein
MAAYGPHVSSTDIAKDKEYCREGRPQYIHSFAVIFYNYRYQHSNAA